MELLGFFSSERENSTGQAGGIFRRARVWRLVAARTELHRTSRWHLSESQGLATSSGEREAPPRKPVASLGESGGWRLVAASVKVSLTLAANRENLLVSSEDATGLPGGVSRSPLIGKTS